VDKRIIIYTDGSSRGNPGPGGYGIVMEAVINNMPKHQKELAQGYSFTTNNRMELMAVIVGLELINQEGWRVEVYSDSKYVVDAIQKRWIAGWIRKGWKDVKNPDLWQRLLLLYEKLEPTFHWVKGHASNPKNNRCDELATNAAINGPYLPDTGYKIG